MSRQMQRLSDERGCNVVGIDVEKKNVTAVISRGLPVVSADLNQGLADIPSDTFDFVVLRDITSLYLDQRASMCFEAC